MSLESRRLEDKSNRRALKPIKQILKTQIFMSKDKCNNGKCSSINELIELMTHDHYRELEYFTENRLRRATCAGMRKRAVALHCARSIIHSAIERFVLGDAGLSGGRVLNIIHRKSVETFIFAVRASINSIIYHAVDKFEYSCEHLTIEPEAIADEIVNKADSKNIMLELELRDIERVLFRKMSENIGDDKEMQTALESLRNDCVTGHSRGICNADVTTEAKRRIRKLAKKTWKNMV